MTATCAQPRPFLDARTARDLMTPNPVSIAAEATIHDALQMLLDRGISGAPVITAAGRPVGVVSRTDLLRHDHETLTLARLAPEFYERPELEMKAGEQEVSGVQVEVADHKEVRDVMSHVVFKVTEDTCAYVTVREMLRHRVHRLFVVDAVGTLIGVVSALDVLRHIAHP
jgi:CBS domain-containing protein